MNPIIAESRAECDLPLEVGDIDIEERITLPDHLRALDSRFVLDDKDTSLNRAVIQEHFDFEPPYDQEELDRRGQGERFNVNYGLGVSIKNEAVGAYLDLFTSPAKLVKIALNNEVDEDRRETFAAIMSEEWTKMFRAWDTSMANMLLLAETFVCQGIGIPWFPDDASVQFEVGSLEDCHFPNDSVAIPSKIEIMTIRRSFTITELYSKIEKAHKAGEELGEDINGWNGKVIKRLIETAKPKTPETAFGDVNFEAQARAIKASRLGASHLVPTIEVVWGVVRELDGKVSVYACPANPLDKDIVPGSTRSAEDKMWLYRNRNAYDDMNQAFQIFPFSVGNKNRIYTIRGLGYAIYEPSQADNILRCKMMDSARHRSSEIYQAEAAAITPDDLQFVDVGHALIAPKGLRNLQSTNNMRLPDSIGYALDSNMSVMGRHSSGLAENPFVKNPNARRNEMQVALEAQNIDKMQGFALSLWYGPYDKLMRELVRRSFTETQDDLAIQGMIEAMKESCVARGVPREIFGKIDLPATVATRLIGAGSKGSRIVGYQQGSQLISSMDATGQESFFYDFASEIFGADRAERYFGIPGQRRGHVDEAIVQLENEALLEGDMIEPVDGENRLVHLRGHIAVMVETMDEVEQGRIDLGVWTLKHIPLFRHAADTLEATTVHESLMDELNSHRQAIQQMGEVIENGLRHLNKNAAKEGAPALDENGQPIPPQEGAEAAPGGQQQPSPADLDNQMKMQRLYAETRAKIATWAEQSKAKMAIDAQESIARIALLDAETAAKMRRERLTGGPRGE